MCRNVLHVEFNNKEVQLSEEDDETDDVYVGLSARETTDREATDREAGDEDDTEKDGNDNEGVGGVLTFDEDIEMHDGVYQPRDDGMDLVLGQEFITKEAAKFHILTASYQKCFEFDIIKSDTKRFVVKCRGAKEEDCKWFVRIAKLKNSDIWTVRSFINQHTCSVVTTRTLPDGEATDKETTDREAIDIEAGDKDHTENDATDNEGTGGVLTLHEGIEMHDVVYQPRDDGIDLDLGQEFRTKEAAKVHIQTGAHQKCFEFDIIKSDTKRFVIKCRGAKEGLGASIEGFRAMRKVLIVDATHLKNVYGGVLFVATAQDPDHHHYPIAFGVADGENDESWTWFMEQLKLAVPNVPGLVFLSDRNRSLIKSVRLVFPEAEHGYCIWHLSQNVKSHVHNNKDTCAFKFRECAHAYTVAEFKYLYHAFRRKYPSAAVYLDKSVEEKKWARCYFKGDRKKAAEVPYNLKLVPIVEEEMSKRCVEAGFLTVKELNSFHLEYSVQGADGKVYTVDMAMYTCSCEQFDKDKYPCVHAVAAATFMTDKAGKELHLSEYCSKYYLVEQWALAYHRTIYPVPHMSDWVIPEEVRAMKILPPDFEVKKGKPQQTRFPSVGESRGRGKRGRWSGRGRARGTGRARGEGLAAYFECGSGSGSGV
ncbi:hypothetical protein Bca101_015465 [Brassica carinata]